MPPWAKDLKIGNQAINARLDSAATKPMFRGARKSRRCLIPASGYYEWRELRSSRSKEPRQDAVYVSREDGVPMTFAGLWERWGPDKLLTPARSSPPMPQTASEELAHPVCRSSCRRRASSPFSGEDPALDPDIDCAAQITPVSPKMNKPSYNEPDCIEALTA
jgi:putative SOS response-associated peptidase YedK